MLMNHLRSLFFLVDFRFLPPGGAFAVNIRHPEPEKPMGCDSSRNPFSFSCAKINHVKREDRDVLRVRHVFTEKL